MWDPSYPFPSSDMGLVSTGMMGGACWGGSLVARPGLSVTSSGVSTLVYGTGFCMGGDVYLSSWV